MDATMATGYIPWMIILHAIPFLIFLREYFYREIGGILQFWRELLEILK